MSAAIFSQTLSPELAKKLVIKSRGLRKPEKARQLQRLQDATIMPARHGSIRVHTVPKKGSELRKVYVFAPEDQAAAHVVRPGWQAALQGIAHEADVGAIPGRGRDQAFNSLRNYLTETEHERPVVVLTDVQECYDTVPRDPLFRQRIGKVQRKQLNAWLNAYEKIATYKGKGVPQGSPLSPVLCALSLTEKVLQHVRSRFRGCFVASYVDDVCMVAKDPKVADAMLRYLAQLLRDSGMSLSERKTETHFLSPGTTFGYLGLEIQWVNNRMQVGIPTRAFEKIWERLENQKRPKAEILSCMQGWLSSLSCVTCPDDRARARRFISLCQRRWSLGQGIWTPPSWGARGYC